MTIPIKDSKAKVIGVLQAINKKYARGFYKKDCHVIKKFLQVAGPILSQARLHEELLAQNRRSKALIKIAKAVDGEILFDAFIKKMMIYAKELLNCEQIHLFLIDELRQEIYCKIENKTITRSIEKGGFAGQTATQGTTVNLPAMMDWGDKTLDENLYIEIKKLRPSKVKRKRSSSHKRKSQNSRSGAQQRNSETRGSRDSRDSRNSSSNLNFLVNGRPKGYIHSLLCVPIKDMSEKSVAVMWAVNKTTRKIKIRGEKKPEGKKTVAKVCTTFFSEDDQEMCEAFCAQVGQCLRRFSTDITLMQTGNQEQGGQAESLLHLFGHTVLSNRKTQLATPMQPSKRLVNKKGRRSKGHGSNSIQSKKETDFKIIVEWPINTGLLAIDNPLYQPETSNRNKLLKSLKTIQFNVWDYERETLVQLILEMFETVPNMLKKLAIDMDTLRQFILAIAKLYHDVPYHNLQHGFSVLQYAYYIIHNTDLAQKISSLEIFSLMIGALAHDVDHPGHTNLFEIATEGIKAQTYNYQAVLENHHCNTTLRILRDPKTNIFNTEVTNLERTDVIHARNCFIQGILATDMTEHFEMCHKLERMKPKWASLNMEKPDDRQLLINVAIHSADLGGNAQPGHIARVWKGRIHQEFSEQVEKEKSLGLESLSFMMGLDDPIEAAKNQQFFLDFVMKPLWKNLTLMWPQLKESEEYLDKNRETNANIFKNS